MKKEILISVVMPVYNGEKYLSEAIESVIAQTYPHWELLIYNDASTDKSFTIADDYVKKESRIRIIEGKTKQGQSVARNAAMRDAKGSYIALLDADDIALPERFDTQLEFMETNPDIAITGSWVAVRDGKGMDREYKSETNPDIIASGMLFNAMLVNSSVMMRKSFLDENNLSYDESSPFLAEDYKLWVKSAALGRIAIIPKVLTIYRKHDGSISAEKKVEHTKKTSEVQRIVLEGLGITPIEEEIVLHSSVYTKSSDPLFVQKELAWFSKIKEANKKSKKYSPKALSYTLEKIWYTVSSQNLTGRSLPVFIFHRFGSITRHIYLSAKLLTKWVLS